MQLSAIDRADARARGSVGEHHEHVIVDVAYRLFPETDLPGMVADTNRAVAWVKHHAVDLQIQPDRIVDLHGLNLDSAWQAIDTALEPDPARRPVRVAPDPDRRRRAQRTRVGHGLRCGRAAGRRSPG